MPWIQRTARVPVRSTELTPRQRLYLRRLEQHLTQSALGHEFCNAARCQGIRRRNRIARRLAQWPEERIVRYVRGRPVADRPIVKRLELVVLFTATTDYDLLCKVTDLSCADRNLLPQASRRPAVYSAQPAHD